MTGHPPRDPVRLRDDPGVAAALRDDLRAVSTADFAGALDVEAGLEGLRRALHGSTATGTIASGAWLGGAAVLAVVVALLIPLGARRPTVEPARVAPAPEPEVAIHTPVIPELERRTLAAPESTASVRAPIERRHRPASVIAAPASAPASAPEPDDAYRREVEHLDRVRRALDRDPARALALCEAGDRAFPAGLLGVERRGYAILALLGLGRRAEAEARAAAFLREHPDAPLSSRIRRALATG